MIDVQHLRKEYGPTVALENLTLRVPEGEVYGLIGPNGAGKTTLLRILATLLEPTYGQVRIGGVDALDHPLRVRPVINYMSDFFSLYNRMLVWEYLDHFARCYGVDHERRSKLVDQVLDLVTMQSRRDAEIKSLSRGMRQRLCFARTLLHEPKVLLLDEPASGLDPAGRLEFRAFIKQLHAMGRTIVISSHILSDLADFCTSVGILERGVLLISGRVEEVLAKLEPGLRLDIEVACDVGLLQKLLEAHQGVDQLRVQHNRAVCVWRSGRETLPDLHRRIVTAGVPLISLEVRSDSLEDLYMTIAQHETS